MLRALLLTLALCAPAPSAPDEPAECITDTCTGCIDDCLTPANEE